MPPLPRRVRRALHRLEDALPVALPVEVLAVPLPWCGDCHLVDGEYRIRLSTKQKVSAIVDTLANEWAHARTWRARSKQEHPDEWGVEYARAYRLVIDEVK